MPDRGLEQLQVVFKALADSTRLRILGLLAGGEVCVCDIHDSLSLPQPKTSRHLAYLRRSGLVETRREGLWVYYRLADLADPVVATVVDASLHALTHVDRTGPAFDRLTTRRSRHRASPPAPAPGVTRCCGNPPRRQMP